MASRSQHDFAFSAPFEPDQKIVVPVTQAGRYYVLAYGDSGGPADYTVQASLLNFTVLDKGYGQGGNAGNLTLQINGAKFDRTVTAYLMNGSQQLWADDYYFVSQSRLYATFDLTHLALGTYDLVLGNGVGGQAAGPERTGGRLVRRVRLHPDRGSGGIRLPQSSISDHLLLAQ